MKKIVLGPAMGELEDGADPAMSVGVATECAGGIDVSLSGLIHPEGRPIEQARRIFEGVEEIIVDDLDGDLADVTHLRFYVREDAFTTDLRQRLHDLRRELFDYPEYPAATMIGVSQLVHDDAVLEVEAEARIPDGEWDVTVVTPEE